MRFLRILFIVSVVLISFSGLSAQLSDTLRLDDILELVREYHPVARQSEIFLKQGEAEVLAARGGFDPKIDAGINQKYYKDTEYYDRFGAGIEIPTPIGLSVIGGYNRNEGSFLNPESSVPDQGLYQLGLKIPLAQGLLIDERRAVLRQAKIFRDAQRAEQQLLLNDLYLNVRLDYWEWAKTYYQLKILQEGEALAQIRLEAVVEGALIGDRAIIDTVEARTILFSRKLDRQAMEVELLQKAAILSSHLWLNNDAWLFVDSLAIPEWIDLSGEDLDRIIELQDESFITTHPELVTAQANLDQLDVERRLKQNKLLPKVNLKYNALAQPAERSYTINDYTWGLEFSMPLFLRKERGELEMNRLKMESYNLVIQDKRTSLINKAQGLRGQLIDQLELIDIGDELVSDQLRLLDAERRLFRVGESSLFLVNSRESKYLDTRLKQVKIWVDQKKLGAYYRYTLGRGE